MMVQSKTHLILVSLVTVLWTGNQLAAAYTITERSPYAFASPVSSPNPPISTSNKNETSETAISSDVNAAELISLYSSEDPVIELVNTNLTVNIYDPEKIWFVEFYAHWCGYCQRFSPIWKQLARDFDVPSWYNILQFGAVNCAQQSCDRFSIQGTPTLRLFYGGYGTKGIDVPANMDVEQLRIQLLQQLEIAQSYGFVKSQNLPNFLLMSGLQTPSFGRKKMLALIVEESNRGVLGRDIVFHASKRHADLEVRRMDWMYATNSIFNPRRMPTSFPALVLVPLQGNQPNWSQMKVSMPMPLSPSLPAYREELLNFIEENYVTEETTTVSSTTTTISSTTTTMSTTTTTYGSLDLIEEQDGMDYSEISADMGDLERSIHYMLSKEIPATEMLDELRLNTVYSLLESLVRYLPLRQPLRNFLVILRDWPAIMEYKALSGAQYKQKVEELESIYKPFEATPSEWMGCKGSSAQYRGYPCSVWQLFHSLMVNAAIKGDPSMVLGGSSSVAKAMVNYVHYFFSCRHCAENFRLKVETLGGFLPNTPRDSILWLWQIHNMANVKLRGDATEDPSHPKMVWPAPSECRQCRSERTDLLILDPQIAFVQGTLWNLTNLVEHNIKVYAGQHLRPIDLTAFRAQRDVHLQSLYEAEDGSIEEFSTSVQDFCSKYS